MMVAEDREKYKYKKSLIFRLFYFTIESILQPQVKYVITSSIEEVIELPCAN